MTTGGCRVGWRQVLVMSGLATVGVGLTAPVAAQEVLRGRLALHINYGGQTTSDTRRDEVAFRAYGEEARFVASHAIAAGPVIDGGGYIQVRPQLSVGASYSQHEASNLTTVTGTVPHPILFGSDRSVGPELLDLTHREQATHIHVAWLLPLSQYEKLDVRVMGGPTYFSLTQSAVTGVLVSEAGGPPFAAVNVDQFVVGELVKSGWGAHIGADVTYMMTTYVGVGAFARFSGGSVDLPTGDTVVTTSVGGFQGGGGLRIRF